MNTHIRGKQRARKLALQSLYQWLMSAAEPSEIEAQSIAANDMNKVDVDYFRHIFHGVCKQCEQIEEVFTPHLDRPITHLNPIEHSILRLSTFELLNCPELPFQVILREAVLLAKEFGSQDGYRYVNGVLNKVARQIRTTEISMGNE